MSERSPRTDLGILRASLIEEIQRFETYWRDYDFEDGDDLEGLRKTLAGLALKVHEIHVLMEVGS